MAHVPELKSLRRSIKDCMAARCMQVHRLCHKRVVSNHRFYSGSSRSVASTSFGGEIGWRMNNVKIPSVLGGDSSQVIEYGTYAVSIHSGECGIGIGCWASAAFASAIRCCFRSVWIRYIGLHSHGVDGVHGS